MNPTEEQQLAIDSPHPKIFCAASAGSGKSTVLVARILRLVADGIDPQRICAMTFTNAGSKVMQERLTAKGVSIGSCSTLHSFLLNLIRKHGELIGYPRGRFTILDNEEATEFFLSIVEKHRWKGTKKGLGDAVLKGPPVDTHGLTESELVAAGYWQELRRAKLLTFDAILILGERLLKAMAVKMVPLHFTHFLIDEVQDSSSADFRIYDLLAEDADEMFEVGDDSQSIYQFRGADVSQCLALTRNPEWQVLTLQSNFRSGANICRTAQSLIEHNADRFAKQTISAVDYPGNVQFAQFKSPAVEASFIAQEIARVQNPAEVAVLLRTNDLVEEYANHLRAMSIPIAQSRPPVRPVDWPRLRVVLSFLASPENDYAAYRCACAVMSQSEADLLKKQASEAFTSINQMWERIPVVSIGELNFVLRKFPMSAESLQRIRDASERLPESASMPDLILELGREDEYVTGEGVVVGTIHSAKGREFDHVFLPAFEQQIIPSERKSEDIQESRRLAYVAVTRARHRLCISYCENRVMRWGSPMPVPVQPSQFIAEMQKGLTLNGGTP